ncbi:hypothetical protein [Bradyrhizobium sp. CCBAU 51627]|uniref:hypothetical protein n=1 Tax=Bradyrhizobium sp. CCBAU 51627 TaxID=1325088 RepID=UPI0023059B20|nr:hypothetical protein [Bradyrhizobium sp. CCBAU 51627]MDA9437241.1 hypothetical protein [Bradyrhizobium sp. CCBAU 51627]
MSIDDTLPDPADVERLFIENVSDGFGVRTWLEERDINPARIGKAALITYGFVWNSVTGRYDFTIYPQEHVGPKYCAFAVPVYEGGQFVDLLLIGDDGSFETVSCRASWLGRDNINQSTIRLHAHPLNWLQSGCTGVCHIASISRAALKELVAVQRIECSDIRTAMEAWDWGFGDDEGLSRFWIDDTVGSIRTYFEADARWRIATIAAIPEAFR